MPTSTILALAATTTLGVPESTAQPGLRSADIVGGPGSQAALELVPAPGAKHYALYSKADSAGWPHLWIDHYDKDGVKQWSRHHEIKRTPAGKGFEHVRATATDYLGTLYFSYYSKLNDGTSGVIKLAQDDTLVWESPVEKCWGPAHLFAFPGAKDVVMTCGPGATRRAELTGSQIWRHNWSEQGIMHRRHQAAIDNLKNVYIFGAWDTAALDDYAGGTELYKFTPEGDLVWHKRWDTRAKGLARPKYAFVPKDQGIVTVTLQDRSGGGDKIEINKYDMDGELLASHALDPGASMSDDSTVIARHTRPLEIVYVAWAPNGGNPSPGWNVASAQFEQVPAPPIRRRRAARPGRATSSSSSSSTSSTTPEIVAKGPVHEVDISVHPMVWRGKTLMSQNVGDGKHDRLVEMDVSPIGQPYLVGIDVDEGAEYLRLTTLSRFQGGESKTVRYRRPGRDARPTHIFAGEQMIYVLGQDDALPGPNTGDDTDVLHLVFWKKKKPKRASTRKLRPVGSGG